MNSSSTTSGEEVESDNQQPSTSGSERNKCDIQQTSGPSRKRSLCEDDYSKNVKLQRTGDLIPKTYIDQGAQQNDQLSNSGCNFDESALASEANIESSSRKSSLHINDLPLPVLLKVLNFLSTQDLLQKVALISHSWCNLAQDSSLWRRLCFRRYKRISDDILLRLTSLSEQVQYLDISDQRQISSEGVASAIRNCQHLRTLKLLRCIQVQSHTFLSISENCPSLQQLFMDGCYALTDEDLTKIAVGCPKLELLRINQCNRITTAGIEAIASHCPQLQQLTMDQCTKITDAAMRALVEKCPKLQTISCMSCNFTDEGVSLLSKAKNLRFMEVSNIRTVKNCSIIDIVSQCPKLESVNLSLCHSINDTCIDFIVKNAKCLKRLYLVSCDLSDDALISIGEHAKLIEIVDVGWCNAITDHGVKTISRTCKTLTYLGLMRCDRVTIEETEDLVVKYPQITYSTKWLDCKRLLEQARREGVAITIPELGAPALSKS